jgi:hypothetical protein
MSGIINATAQPAASPSQLSNPLLQEAETKIEASIVDPALKTNWMKVVVAGMHIALAGGPNGFMGKLRQSQDPISDCAKGAASLVLIMRREARGVMPPKAMILAGMTLLFHGLDFLDRSGIAKIAEPELDRATTVFTNFLFQKLGITTQMIQNLTSQVHQITQDPQAMEAIKMRAGVVPHPGAAVMGPPVGGGQE